MLEIASPISALPEDVLLDIFKRCLPDFCWIISPAPSDAPVLLTHVCLAWRHLAIASPVLWQHLRWDVRIGRCNTTELDIFAAAAVRAKSAPLGLQVIIRQGVPLLRSTQKRAASPAKRIPNIPSRLFAPTSTSLTTLLLMGLPIDHIHALPPGSFPSLGRLILDLEGPDLRSFPWEKKGPIKAFFNTPALRRVAFSSSPPFKGYYSQRCFVSQHTLLPWEHLTHILDFEPTFDTAPTPGDLLGHSELRYLLVVLLRGDVGEKGCFKFRAEGADVKRLDELETLAITYRDPDVDYPAFIDVYEFPNLKALRLDGETLEFNSSNTWPGYLMERFLAKLGSLRHLTYLSLCHIMVDQETLRHIILATPHLNTLDAQIYENYEYFFEAITWDAESQALPKLETLILEMDDSHAIGFAFGTTIDAPTFGNFLESRVQPGSLFRKVVLYSAREVRISDDKPFVRVALSYLTRGLVLEKRILKKRCWKEKFMWVERDSELQDWSGLAEIHFL